MTTEQTPEMPTDTVVYMDNFLVRRFHKYAEEADRLMTLAEDLSKQEKDKFAAPVRAKAKVAHEKAEAVKKHIGFIMRGGRGRPIPTNGYSLNPVQIPVVTMTIDLNPSKKDD